MGYSIKNVDKSKCAKYREPIILGTHTVQRHGEDHQFTVYDTLTATHKMNKIGGVQGTAYCTMLGYESKLNKDNYYRLVFVGVKA